jgi:hypothetical protein
MKTKQSWQSWRGQVHRLAQNAPAWFVNLSPRPDELDATELVAVLFADASAASNPVAVWSAVDEIFGHANAGESPVPSVSDRVALTQLMLHAGGDEAARFHLAVAVLGRARVPVPPARPRSSTKSWLGALGLVACLTGLGALGGYGLVQAVLSLSLPTPHAITAAPAGAFVGASVVGMFAMRSALARLGWPEQR